MSCFDRTAVSGYFLVMSMDRWRKWIGWGGVIMLATAVILVTLIASGLFDPQPVGPFQSAMALEPLTIPAGEQVVRRLDHSLPAGDFSVQLETNHASGEQDVVYGLAIGQLRVGVSPLGYVAVQDGETAVLPLQPWPHVTAAANEIWVDVRENTITIRINRELLWEGELTRQGNQFGVWGQSWGETAVIHFPTITFYGAK